jgi:hypothetical protein
VAEQSVFGTSSRGSGNTSASGSSSTQVVERPQRVSGTGEVGASGRGAGSTKAVRSSAQGAESMKSATGAEAAEPGSAATSAGSGGAAARSGRLDARAKAVPVAAVSFVSGLVGLLVANLILGPLAVVLGLIGLRVDSGRRGRAVLGIVLGIADIAVFVLLAAHAGSHHGSLSWSFFGH